MLGLKRGSVRLSSHKKEWVRLACDTIEVLKNVLGDTAKAIEHIGSTSIPEIKAKPIIDIAVAVDDFDDIMKLESELENKGFWFREGMGPENQLLFASGSYYDGSGDEQTHFIHIVRTGSSDWQNYINFRNYLIANPEVAKEYENLKISLTSDVPTDGGREKYTAGKSQFITMVLEKATGESGL